MMWLVNMPVIVIPKSSLTKEEIENKAFKGQAGGSSLKNSLRNPVVEKNFESDGECNQYNH